MRVDNLLPALRIHLVFVVVGGASLLGFGALSGSLEFPIGFWLTLALYPIWGVAQQFALQSLIARNLSSLFTRAWTLAVAAAVLFALSHYPRIDLVGLTLVAGLGFTVIYQRLPNLWAVGTAHGVLGTIAAYAVLGEDPGGAILGWLTRI